eukprot:scaffold1170_cov174-Amphora_coffeaeformis.AAC.10
MNFLIAQGADPNHRAFDGMSPLHREVLFGGNLHMVDLLLNSGKVDPDLPAFRPGQESITALQIAVTQGRSVAIPIAQSLVKNGANVEVRRANGRTLLHSVEMVDMMEFLLEQGLDIHATQDNGSTALHEACFMGKMPVVKGLVAAGADANRLNRNHQTPLHLSIMEGHVEVVKFLISEARADPYLRGDDGAIALHMACLVKQTEVAVWLVEECSMKPCLWNHRGYDALHYACKYSPGCRDPLDLVRELLRRDPNLGKGVPTALHLAAEWSSDLCRLLVKDYGFDLMAESVLGSIPLSHATRMGSVSTIHCLVDLMQERGHNLNVGDARGLTSLHEAILGDSLEKVRALLQRGLDVNAVSKYGETPLHVASLTSGDAHNDKEGKQTEDENVTEQQVDILESLIDRGAYAVHLDRDDMYPFCYSAKKGSVTKTFLLLRAAASQGFFGKTFLDPPSTVPNCKLSPKRELKDDAVSCTKRCRLA